jgi:hypothetical protein
MKDAALHRAAFHFLPRANLRQYLAGSALNISKATSCRL